MTVTTRAIEYLTPVRGPNRVLSRAWVKMVKGKNKECYSNAIRVFARIQDDEAQYVEGYVRIIDSPIPIAIQHGWVEITNKGRTTIIDATPGFVDKRKKVYYPGVRYSFDDVMNLLGEEDVTLPLIGVNELRNEDMMRAYFSCQSDIYGPEQYDSLQGSFMTMWPKVQRLK